LFLQRPFLMRHRHPARATLPPVQVRHSSS
jgi:hypothetical protein